MAHFFAAEASYLPYRKNVLLICEEGIFLDLMSLSLTSFCIASLLSTAPPNITFEIKLSLVYNATPIKILFHIEIFFAFDTKFEIFVIRPFDTAIFLLFSKLFF